MKMGRKFLASLGVSACIAAAAVSVAPNSAQADVFDAVPHIVPGLVGMQIGDALLSVRTSTDLGLSFVKAQDLPETYTGFADGSVELELAQQLAAGPRVGLVGKLHANLMVDIESGETSGTDSLDPEEQKALVYVDSTYGRLEAGYIHASSQTARSRGIDAGRGGLSFAGLSYNVAGLGARYRLRSGSNTVEVQADENARAMLGYGWKRAFRANTYLLSADASYAHEETFEIPSTANSVLAGRLVQSFGAVAASKVDYGTLYMMASAGAEHFRAVDSSDDSETRVFGSLGISKKWGRTTLSAAAALEHYLDAEYTRAEVSLGGEFALSRGFTLVGGYNATYAAAELAVADVDDAKIDHKLEAALRVSF